MRFSSIVLCIVLLLGIATTVSAFDHTYQTYNTLLKEYVRDVIKDLHPREQKILEMRFGLMDGVSHTLEEVGEEFGVTRERIRQIEAKALEKIERAVGHERLRNYI